MKTILKKLLSVANSIQPAQFMVIGFGLVILLGGLVLNLPIATKNGESVGFLNSLFTATSAVCVTGLVVVDTGTYWSEFGQFVIITLIQTGGLGFMTVATMFSLLTGKKINLRERLLIQESLNQRDLSGLVKLTRYIIVMTFIIEGIGALLLSIVYIPALGLLRGVWYSIFHSISAFCNAGFDLMGAISGEYTSLTSFVNNSLINFVICSLIILGGIGFPVLLDIINNKKYSKLNVHSKIVINTSGILIAIGVLFIFIAEFNNKGTLGSLNMKEKLLSSVFQSVTLRTAGFATVDMASLHQATKFFMSIIMFIGGSPAGTAGGVKTVTFVIGLLYVRALMRGDENIHVFKRTIDDQIVKRALTIMLISFAIALTGLFILSISEQADFIDLLFEVFSAFATVGLTAGITPTLTFVGKIVIIILMYIGRIGPITMVLIFVRKYNAKKGKDVNYIKEHILIG